MKARLCMKARVCAWPQRLINRRRSGRGELPPQSYRLNDEALTQLTREAFTLPTRWSTNPGRSRRRSRGKSYSAGRAAPGDVSLVRIDSSVRSIDSRAAELMSRPMKTRRTGGMDRLSVSDSHSTTPPPSTAV